MLLFNSSRAFVWSFIFIAIFNAVETNCLPSGFIAEVVTSKNAISGAFARNPRNDWKPMMLLVNKNGIVSVLEHPDESSNTTEILRLENEMCTDGERGLQSVAVHPQFEENRYIYLYYAKYKEGCLADGSGNSPWNVVSRFVMDPKTLMLNYTERVEIWRLVSLLQPTLLMAYKKL